MPEFSSVALSAPSPYHRSLTYLLNMLLWSEKSQLCISPRTVVFISMAIVTRSLEHGLCTLTAVSAFG